MDCLPFLMRVLGQCWSSEYTVSNTRWSVALGFGNLSRLQTVGSLLSWMSTLLSFQLDPSGTWRASAGTRTDVTRPKRVAWSIAVQKWGHRGELLFDHLI